ncbi:MAG: hypothetical protein R3C26_21980 [Calditrichia bacterium]
MTAIAPQPVQPEQVRAVFFSAYPNPFNPTTTLVFRWKHPRKFPGKFLTPGREVQTVAAGQSAPGEQPL